jgi:hypothetical protein
MAFGQIVKNRDFITLIQQLLDADATDVTGSTSDKNGLHSSKLLAGLLATINSGKAGAAICPSLDVVGRCPQPPTPLAGRCRLRRT